MRQPGNINLEVADKTIKMLLKLIIKLAASIKKYYHCEMIKEKLGMDFEISDEDNDVFRYPENGLKIDIDYGNVLERINDEDIKEILQDVESLAKIFNSMGFVFDTYLDSNF